jgi:hypothetical protein
MPTTINQLVSAKLLLDTAKRQVKQSGIEKAFSVLHAHDALDWILQYLYDDSATKKKGKLMFLDYVSAIAKHPDKFGSLDEIKCDQLNTMRSNFKHNFIIPNDKQAEEIVLWTEIQIESLVRTYTGKALSEFSTLDAITSKEVREKIQEADQSLADNKAEYAMCHLAIAYAILESLKKQQLEDVYSLSMPNSSSLTFSNSFFLGLDKILGRDFGKAWDEIIKSIEYQNSLVSVSLLGVNHAEYIKFMNVTPRPQRTLDGKYHVSFTERLAEKARKTDVNYWREFIINIAISNSL